MNRSRQKLILIKVESALAVESKAIGGSIFDVDQSRVAMFIEGAVSVRRTSVAARDTVSLLGVERLKVTLWNKHL